MNPEDLLRQAREALRQGVSVEEINTKLQSLDVGANTFEELQQLAAGESPERQAALQREAERGNSALSDFLRMAAQGATLGFADELTGLAAGAIPGGQNRQEATEASRQRVEDLRRLNSGASLASEVAGGVGAGTAAGGLLRAGLSAAGVDAGGGLLGMLTAGPRTTPARAVGRATARGAAGGAAEEFARGAGESEGGLIERVQAGGKRAPIGAGLGAFTGGVLALPGAAKRAFRETREAGEQVASDLRATATEGERVLPSQLRQQAQAKSDRARSIFQDLEEAGEEATSIDMQEVFLRNPTARNALSEQAAEALESNQALTFTQVDDASSNLKRVADAFKRGDPNVRAEDVRAASEAFDELDRTMRESLEGFDDAKRLWAEKSAAMRALSEGRKMFGKQADDVRSAMREFSDNPEAREFFRQGLINEATRKLERFRGSFREPPAAVKNYFNRGRGFEEELRLLFPSDEAFEEFTRRVDITRASASAGQKAAILAQAIAFASPLGTSLFGRLIG